MSIYDAGMYRQAGESLTDYYARLKRLRGGSILGTYGMMDQPTQPTPVSEQTSAPLGEVVVQQAVQDEDNSDPVTPTKPASLEDMIRQASGQAFDPLDALGLLVPGGTLMAAGAGYMRDRQIMDALLESGLTQDQAEIAIKDPDYVAQLLYGGKMGVTPESDYDPTKTTGATGFGLIGGMFKDFVSDDVASTLGVPAPTVAMPTLTGMPQGMLARNGQDLYITSDGDVRDVTGKSEATQAGLRAVTAGMFDTPDYFEDDYAEPEPVQTVQQAVAALPAYTAPALPTQQEEDNSDSYSYSPPETSGSWWSDDSAGFI